MLQVCASRSRGIAGVQSWDQGSLHMPWWQQLRRSCWGALGGRAGTGDKGALLFPQGFLSWKGHTELHKSRLLLV